MLTHLSSAMLTHAESLQTAWGPAPGRASPVRTGPAAVGQDMQTARAGTRHADSARGARPARA